MLYKFISKDASDVLMLETNGRRLLEIIGKTPDPKGIILPTQMPAAIDALKNAIAQEESPHNEADADKQPMSGLGLRQRAAPLIDMLQRSLEEGHNVMWGV